MDPEEQKKIHRAVMKETGFWGAQGAGCLIMSTSTGRVLVALRSTDVKEPHTWGVWGSVIDDGEVPVEAALRELREECGYLGDAVAVPMFVFALGTFRYSNFLMVVDEEFEPILDPETDEGRWCDLDDLPQPLHFGLEALLRDPASMRIMRERAARPSPENRKFP